MFIQMKRAVVATTADATRAEAPAVTLRSIHPEVVAMMTFLQPASQEKPPKKTLYFPSMLKFLFFSADLASAEAEAEVVMVSVAVAGSVEKAPLLQPIAPLVFTHS